MEIFEILLRLNSQILNKNIIAAKQNEELSVVRQASELLKNDSDGKTNKVIKKIIEKTANVAKLYEEERKRCDKIRIEQLRFIKEFEDTKETVIKVAVDEALLKERAENTPNYLRTALDQSERARAKLLVEFEKLKGNIKRLKSMLNNMELDKEAFTRQTRQVPKQT